jgi:hypothetical protein
METQNSNIKFDAIRMSGAAASSVPEMDLFSKSDDFTAGSFVGPDFVQSDENQPRDTSKNRALIILLILLIPVGIYIYDESLFPDAKKIKEFLAFFNFESSTEEGQGKKSPGSSMAVGEGPIGPSTRAGFDAAGNPLNPYWNLPNYLEGALNPMGRAWSSQEEDIATAGITNRFQWQRYRTVTATAKERLAGSETILREALEQPKLWTRMRAAAGLADFGIEISFADSEKAIGNAENSLLFRYLKRFEARSTQGERYLLRQIIRLVDEPARLAIIRALAKHPGTLRDLYLVAAQFDPGRSIKEWTRFKTPEIAPANYRTYRNIVLGKQELIGKRRATIVPPKSEVQKVPGQPAANESDLLKIDNIEIYNVTQTEQEEATPAPSKDQANGLSLGNSSANGGQVVPVSDDSGPGDTD